MKKRANEIVAPAVDGALITVDEAALLTDLKVLIQTARQRIALVANSTMTLLYWNLGRRMLKENLQDGRAACGKRILATVSRELTDEFGRGFDERTELNWIHYRLLASQANAAFECSSAPQGRPNHKPVQRPGFDITHVMPALKGRLKARQESHSKRLIWPVLSGLNSINTANLGRCPRLLWSCPVGALQGAAS